jgi:pyruvate dehydrogenase E2 component (dihydrolipoamide acetyltransferase)
MFGTDTFAAIIVPPNAGIIAVGAVKEKPVVKDGQIVVGQMMNATISADHRVGDGAEAAVFMSEFQKNLENPIRLMM